ncbi:hypothetical protein PMIN04_000310 [Paraphaeosphaeria minitans]
MYLNDAFLRPCLYLYDFEDPAAHRRQVQGHFLFVSQHRVLAAISMLSTADTLPATSALPTTASSSATSILPTATTPITTITRRRRMGFIKPPIGTLPIPSTPRKCFKLQPHIQ